MLTFPLQNAFGSLVQPPPSCTPVCLGCVPTCFIQFEWTHTVISVQHFRCYGSQPLKCFDDWISYQTELDKVDQQHSISTASHHQQQSAPVLSQKFRVKTSEMNQHQLEQCYLNHVIGYMTDLGMCHSFDSAESFHNYMIGFVGSSDENCVFVAHHNRRNCLMIGLFLPRFSSKEHFESGQMSVQLRQILSKRTPVDDNCATNGEVGGGPPETNSSYQVPFLMTETPLTPLHVIEL